MSIDPRIQDELMQSFLSLDRKGYLPSSQKRALYGAENSVILTGYEQEYNEVINATLTPDALDEVMFPVGTTSRRELIRNG